jgi:hypothetical protein
MSPRPRFANPTPFLPVEGNRFERVRGGFRFDLPGPYTLEWTLGTARERITRGILLRHPEPIPLLTGLAFAATPYVVGAAIVAFAPPWYKPIGLSMMVPGPSDPLLFAAGFAVGQEIETIFD